MRRILVAVLLAMVCALPAMGLTASSWYVPNALTLPELSARPVNDGTAGATEWTTASAALQCSGLLGGGIPTDTTDQSAMFRMGTFQGGLYFVVYV